MSNEITRRRLLSAGLAGVGAVLLPSALTACSAEGGAADASTSGHHSMTMGSTSGSTTASSGSATSSAAPAPVPPPGPELVNPAVRSSAQGVLTVNLEARPAEVDLRVGQTVTTYTYDGAVPGSTWEVRPGDTMRIALQNNLPVLSEQQDMPHANRPHQWTTTNLHTHGLHVSPVGNSDNPFLSIEPGELFDYEIAIPADHSAGLYWYHPHRHGAACQQIRAGMAGAIIVRGDIDDVPEIAAAKERVLFLQAIELGPDYALMDPIPEPTKTQAYFPRTQIYWTVNGTMNPTITMYPGEVQRWRIANAAEGKLAGLALADHVFETIAWDGLTLAEPGPAEDLELGPANRVDILIKAGAPGTYPLVLSPGSSQHPNMIGPGMSTPTDLTNTGELEPRTVATLVVSGSGPEMSIPASLPAYDPPILPVAASRTVRYTVERDPTGEFISFGIDGVPFDPANPPYQVELGTAQEWTVINDSDDQHIHSFHIHVNPYKVIAVDGQPLAVPQWRDTYLVPAAKGGSFTFQSNFVDFAGKFVEHCHVVSHEDLGMMEAIEVVSR